MQRFYKVGRVASVVALATGLAASATEAATGSGHGDVRGPHVPDPAL